jgi:hypothetical protein
MQLRCQHRLIARESVPFNNPQTSAAGTGVFHYLSNLRLNGTAVDLVK